MVIIIEATSRADIKPCMVSPVTSGWHLLISLYVWVIEVVRHFDSLFDPELLRWLAKNDYTYMYGRVPLLFTGNYHNIIDWLDPNKAYFFHLEKKRNACCTCQGLILVPGIWCIMCAKSL